MSGSIHDCAGTILLNNAAGRSLRKAAATVYAADVLDCAGNFSAGDTVYISFRGIDGGQYVVATGVIRCDESVLRQTLGALAPAAVIINASDMKLLWP
jgi:hypothetical protein